jgi:uncharacterized protein (DUF1499 family)
MPLSTTGRAVSVFALVLAVATVLTLAAAGPGTRFGLWHFRIGLGLLRWVAYGAIATAVLALVGLVIGGARGWAALALIFGLAALAVPLEFRRQAGRVPAIHDISTDTADPPAFRAVVPHRKDAANPPEYDGPEVAQKQHEAYPDLKPVALADAPARAFERALAAGRALGWEIVDVSPSEGRFEATDTTPWFGFKDDVVVRIRPEGTGSRLDVRSKSRVGRSDVGANARRIRRFLAQLG